MLLEFTYNNMNELNTSDKKYGDTTYYLQVFKKTEYPV